MNSVIKRKKERESATTSINVSSSDGKLQEKDPNASTAMYMSCDDAAASPLVNR